MSKTFFLLGTVTLVFNLYRPILSISISDLFYFVALIFLLLEGLFSKKPISQWLPIHYFWLPSFFILIGGLIASVQAVNFGSSLSITIKTWFLFSIWLSMGITMVKKGQIRNILIALVIGACFTSIIATLDFITGLGIGSFFSGVPSIYYTRYSGTLGHPNIQGYVTALATPIVLEAIFIIWSSTRDLAKKLFQSVVLCGIFLMLIWANILSGSVGALLGMLLACFIIFLAHSLSNWNISKLFIYCYCFLILTIILFFISSFLFNVSIIDNVRALISSNFERVLNTTAGARAGDIAEAVPLITENPFLGYGMDQGGTGGLDEAQLVTTLYIHNTIIQSWITGGLLTFIGVLIIYLRTLKIAVETIVNTIKGAVNSYILGLAASIIGWVFIDMTEPNLYQRFTWLTVALLLGKLSSLDRKPEKYFSTVKILERTKKEEVVSQQ